MRVIIRLLVIHYHPRIKRPSLSWRQGNMILYWSIFFISLSLFLRDRHFSLVLIFPVIYSFRYISVSLAIGCLFSVGVACFFYSCSLPISVGSEVSLRITRTTCCSLQRLLRSRLRVLVFVLHLSLSKTWEKLKYGPLFQEESHQDFLRKSQELVAHRLAKSKRRWSWTRETMSGC